MSVIVKSGQFSKKYFYIRCSNGEYFLLPKAKGIDIHSLEGRTVPDTETEKSGDIELLKFDITTIKILIYCGACAAISIPLYKVSLASVVLLWSINAHEFMHIFIAARLQCDRLIFGIKIKYFVFAMFYITNTTIYECSQKERVQYYSAGIVTNFIIFVIFFVFSLLPFTYVDTSLVYTTWTTNLSLAFLNAVPFLFTDGYNVLREALEIYDLRQIVLRNFFKPRTIIQQGWIVFAYYSFVVIGWTVIAFSICFWITSFASKIL